MFHPEPDGRLVDSDHLVPALCRLVLDGGQTPDAGVVDERVQTAVPDLHLLRNRGPLVLPSDVEREGKVLLRSGQAVHQRLARFEPQVGDHEPCSLVGKPAADLHSKAAGRTGDED